MALQKRASIDIGSIEMRNVPSPAPTYTSTFIPEDASPQRTNFSLPPKGGSSNNPYFQPTGEKFPTKSGAGGDASQKSTEDESIRLDYHDPNHLHYAGPKLQEYASRRPLRSRMPQKRILIPWVLAAIFFLITVWYTSILAGARFFAILHPLPSSPTVHEINVIINGEVLHGSVSVSTVDGIVPMITIPIATRTTSAASTPTKSSDNTLPITTGRLNGAPIPDTPPEPGNTQGITLRRGRVVFTTQTGFVTVTRRSS